MCIHVKFKLCVFRNRFLNISIKDHVKIHYHILHYSMCYIFVTRKAGKTNHTLWIMTCFYGEICWALSQMFPSARAGRGSCCSTLYLACAQHPLLDDPALKVLGVLDICPKISIRRCIIPAISGLMLNFRRDFRWQQMLQFFLRALGPTTLAKQWSVRGDLSASVQPLSFSLTILHHIKCAFQE